MKIDRSMLISKEDQELLAREEEAKILSQAAIDYLRETDWHVVRNLETGKEIPDEILELRAKARMDVLPSID